MRFVVSFSFLLLVLFDFLSGMSLRGRRMAVVIILLFMHTPRTNGRLAFLISLHSSLPSSTAFGFRKSRASSIQEGRLGVLSVFSPPFGHPYDSGPSSFFFLIHGVSGLVWSGRGSTQSGCMLSLPPSPAGQISIMAHLRCCCCYYYYRGPLLYL